MGQEVLHIANLPSVCRLMEDSGLGGETLAWQDPLYLGPVLALPLDGLAEVRARYFAGQGWGSEGRILSLYQGRNARLREFRRYHEVVLWFDHDLLDQLQLLQLLNWFSQQTMGSTRLSLITLNHFPGVYRFTGLEVLTPAQLRSLWHKRVEVSMSQFELARAAWEAVVATDPRHLQDFSWSDMSSLPFLKDALSRLQEEYPGHQDGLSRSERQILQVVYSGTLYPKHIFAMAQRKEDRPFMSEKAFRFLLRRLLMDAEPCIKVRQGEPVRELGSEAFYRQKIVITATGFKVLAESQDFLFINSIDRWVGGVHLNDANIWRRNRHSKSIRRTYA